MTNFAPFESLLQVGKTAHKIAIDQVTNIASQWPPYRVLRTYAYGFAKSIPASKHLTGIDLKSHCCKSPYDVGSL
jgi:hypothetical protein